jgi:hypothetical protein
MAGYSFLQGANEVRLITTALRHCLRVKIIIVNNIFIDSDTITLLVSRFLGLSGGASPSILGDKSPRVSELTDGSGPSGAVF